MEITMTCDRVEAHLRDLNQEISVGSNIVDTVSELASQLLQNDHPNSDEVPDWSEHYINIDCQESMVSYSTRSI